MRLFKFSRAINIVWLSLFVAFVSSCSTSRVAYYPEKKYSRKQLQEDYRLFRNVLEESHPSLYWFISKDSLDYYFDREYSSIPDSMTEREFRTKLTFVITKIRCGHTSLRYSPRYSRYLDTAELRIFPLSLKCWTDTMALTGILYPQNTLLKRGTIIRSINGHSFPEMRDTFFNYLNGDGYALAGKYQSLSNRGNFGVLYKNVYGLTDSFHIVFDDPSGIEQETTIPVYDPLKDTSSTKESDLARKGLPISPRQTELFFNRNLQVDTSLRSAYMTLNTFSRGYKLKRFFRRSFRSIRKLNLEHLVVDVRANGGGEAGNAILLTQYLSDHKFKIADSLYAIRRSSKYRGHIKWQPLYWLMSTLVTKKHSDGHFHFGYFERHYFKPKNKNHYDKNIYIITGGNSFSATTIFAQLLKGQKNVKIVGEETGGGAYGNTAWMIPEVSLPNTRIRFRLPKFRLVLNSSLVKEGRGVIPDIKVSPTIDDIRNNTDPKEAMVRRLIEASIKNTASGQLHSTNTP